MASEDRRSGTLLVTEVEPLSQAAAAGVTVGARIVGIDGNTFPLDRSSRSSSSSRGMLVGRLLVPLPLPLLAAAAATRALCGRSWRS